MLSVGNCSKNVLTLSVGMSVSLLDFVVANSMDMHKEDIQVLDTSHGGYPLFIEPVIYKLVFKCINVTILSLFKLMARITCICTLLV